MADTMFPKECSGCKKKLGTEDYDEFYSVYQCRKDHWIVCCKVDCQRLLDKRCSKVSEGLRKMQHKLNNDGHTSALRRLPPSEREKLKQYQEAEGKNLMICPFEMKAADRSVPYCAHAMFRKGGYGKQTSDGQDLPPDEDTNEDALEGTPDEDTNETAAGPPRTAPGPPSVDNATDLVNFDMLCILKKEDEDGEETPASNKKTKGTKNKSQKKQKQIITLDWGPGMADEVYPETLAPPPSAKASQPAAWFSDPSTRNINGTAVSQAWNAASNERRMAAQTPAAERPADFKDRVVMLMSTTGCTENKAKELLEQNNHRLESAADAYFRQEAEQEFEPAPKWGPKASPSSMQGQHQQNGHRQVPHEDFQDDQHQEESSSSALPPSGPPGQPPPPAVPVDWQALWDEAQGAYYFWHVPTNHTSWDAPAVEEDEEDDAENAAELARLQAEEDRRNDVVERVSSITCLDMNEARELLESHGWNFPQAVQSHNKKQAEERDRRQAEEQKARELEARRKMEEEESRAAEQARREQLEADQERQRRSQAGYSLNDPLDRYPRQSDLPADCICNQHWRCHEQDANCIHLLKGERVQVVWMDGDANGWVYGHPVDDEGKKGYLPRAILDKVRHGHMPGPHSVGALFSVRDAFKAPDEIAGYLTVGPGDLLKVLHPLDPPYVWAFAQLVQSINNVCQADIHGWVPEDILCDVD